MKKAFKVIAWAVCSLLAVLTITYVVLGFYYNPTFVFGTWINGNYCAGMTVEEVNALLAGEFDDYKLSLIEQDGKIEVLNADQIDYNADYTEAIAAIKEKQNPFNWGMYMIKPVSYDLEPVITYDEQLLEEELKQLNCYMLEAANELRRPTIIMQDERYVLIDKKTEVIDAEKTTELIKTALNKRDSKLSLIDNKCYYMQAKTPQEQEVYDIWEQIEAVQNTTINYQDGALKSELNGQTAIDWISKGGNGEFTLTANGRISIDEEKLTEFIEQLAKVYETSGVTRTWTRPDGKVISIQKKGKKYELDREAEAASIVKALSQGSHVTRKPIYSQVGEPREEIDMGETYIEIDMTAQKLYYYENHVLKLSTNIVTGNTSYGNGTPAAVCSVYAKQKNRVLRGATYESFVYYWMPIKGNIGIHDATWRDEFGGTIYKTAGSHGCVNLPKDKAASLYEMVEVGTPVIMYY
jgi:hypothetical protein